MRLLSVSSLAKVLALALLFVCIPGRANMADTIEGKWNFALDTEGGPREFEADFKLEGSTVGGTWAGQPAKGTFTDGKLELDFEFNSDEVGKGVVKATGKLDADVISGTWAFQRYTGTFKATRPAA